MRTVPLSGKIAAGRVTLVDDEDYDLVMQYRWYVRETFRGAGKRCSGPYAFTMIISECTGRRAALNMHNLIMGIKGVDHRDHDGLNNQRYNLRSATDLQNLCNTRSQLGTTSQYKGVSWSKRKRRWRAVIGIDGKSRDLGFFASETAAAVAYDDAAAEMFGEYACLNFPEGVAPELRDELRTEQEAARADALAASGRALHAGNADWWKRREPTERTCTVCGEQYTSRAVKQTLYCGGVCSRKARWRRDREKQKTTVAALNLWDQEAGGATGG